jgi:hypothetical protein
VILRRLQSLLGTDAVERIEVCRTAHLAPRPAISKSQIPHS